MLEKRFGEQNNCRIKRLESLRDFAGRMWAMSHRAIIGCHPHNISD